MGLNYTLLGIIILALLIVNCSDAADSEVQRDPKTGKNVKDADISNKNDGGKEKVSILEKKEKNQVGSGEKDGADNKIIEDGNGKQVGLKGAVNDQKKNDGTDSVKKKTDDAGSEPKKTDDTGGSEPKKKDDDAGGSETKKKDDAGDSEPKKTDDAGGSQPKKTDDTGGSKPKKTEGSEPKKTNDTGGSKPKKTEGSEPKKTDDTGNPEQENAKDTGGSEKKRANDTATKKDVDKKEGTGGDSDSQHEDISVAQARKEGGEVCDSSSNSCTIEGKAVIACLRVAGSESEELSLLIQNKGKEPVSVTISAPDFVELEKKQVHVQDNKNEKVKVSIGNGESKSGIILKVGDGNCTIDFKDMNSPSSKKDSVSAQLPYINMLKSTPSVWFIFFAALLVIASVCIGNSFRRKYGARNSPSYEKLEMELPVSGVSKVVPESNDGWDDNWGDSWDDEEAPKTPSMPVTPSLSSHGIAARRVNKEAWKD